MGDAGELAKQKMRDTRRFAAFISYSHADADAAAKLQRKLERYRLPKRVAQMRAGEARQIGAIFRDREDFAAAASLSVAIREAIQQAEALIVMCSPDAASSPWVAAEIELFCELHPAKPILAVLLSNEPAVSFPAALTANGNEPLAADLRADGDGEQLGFLKIVAGIAGVPLDTLIQRDAQRRIRRVTAITVSALAAMLVMGIMTAYAIQARNEAARQRAAAEGLVEYMLTDLREKLRGVNRLDVMTAVNERAMAHYRAQGPLSQLPDDSLERRARILHAMGEDSDRNGKFVDALARFREAMNVTKALLTREPRNPDRIFAHAQSEYWVGYTAWRQSDIATTEQHWSNYLTQAAALAAVEPGTVRSLMELGYAHGNLCELLMNSNRNTSGGLKHCQAAIGFQQQALAKEPGNVATAMALANRLGWMADALSSVKQFDAAVKYRHQEQSIIDRLLQSDPRNVELRFRQTWPMIGLALIHYERKAFADASTQLKVLLKLQDRLGSEFPNDEHIAVSRIRAHIIMASNYRALGNQKWRFHRKIAGEMAQGLSDNGSAETRSGVAGILSRFDGKD